MTITPLIQTVEVTLTAKFTATVTGVGPFTYQWERGNNILKNETRNTYVVKNASQEDQNYYRCIVTNTFGGSVISNRLWLQLTRMLAFSMILYWSMCFSLVYPTLVKSGRSRLPMPTMDSAYILRITAKQLAYKSICIYACMRL